MSGTTIPRNAENEMMVFGGTPLKRFPKYAFSKSANACLIHEVDTAVHRWYELTEGGSRFRRMKQPEIIVRTKCGMPLYIEGGRATMCAIPNPDATMCKRCQGQGPTFTRAKESWDARREAKKHIGCVVAAK